ncbi:MAG TPA: O-antigen ligase family protein [Chloroflexota bacterium]|nr:O-antigen ligase family protein [Chloroflexota bacterium]
MIGLTETDRRPWPAIGLAAVLGLLGGVLPPLYGTALLAGGVTTIVILIEPSLGLSALSFAVPFGPSGSTGNSLPVTPTDALVVLILGATLLFWWSGRRETLTLTVAFWPGIVFILVAALSATFVGDLVTSLKEILRWVELLGILVVTATLCQNERVRRLTVGALLVALTLEAGLGWAQFFLRRGPPSFRIGPFLRAYGSFGQPNPFGGYLAMTLPIAIAIVVWQRPWQKRPDILTGLALLATGVGGGALLMSLSRGAWIGVAVGIAVVVWRQTRRGGSLILLGLLAFAALFAMDALHLVPPVISQRLAQITDYFGVYDVSKVTPTSQNWAIIERMAHWQAAWNMYQAHPILGVGPGHYPIAYPDYRVNAIWQDPLGHAHNVYLNVLAEEGFVGLLSYLVQWLAWLWLILSGWRRARRPLDQALVAGGLAGFAAVAFHNIVDDLYVHGLNAQLGLLIGLAGAIDRQPGNNLQESS